VSIAAGLGGPRDCENRKLVAPQNARILREFLLCGATSRFPRQAIGPRTWGEGESELLIHELDVLQVELEMQNDELQRTQVELAGSRAGAGCLTRV
jgi:hypothetical protein